MKLIVDVPDEMIKALEQGCFGSKYSLFDFMGYVLNGTELPKEHGDLIDRNECLKMKVTDLHDKDGITMYAVPTENILRMKPIIEADKENK